jgi:hypothetical protein
VNPSRARSRNRREKGLSSSTFDVLWRFFNIVVSYLLICRVGDFALKVTGDVMPFGIGIPAMGLFSARQLAWRQYARTYMSALF